MRFCNTPGCRSLVERGYCAACRSKRRAAWKHPDTISAQTFTGVLLPAIYGREWQRRRRRFLADHPFCIDCIAEGRPTGLATEVDHRIPHRGDRVLFWDESNWDPRCKSHHSAKTAREVALGGAH